MFSENGNEDAEAPASAPVTTRSGYTIDLNNVPGRVKREMIQSGDLSVDKFTSPDNMPGRKLAILREEAREKMKVFTEELVPNKENPYKVGDIVNFKGIATEIIATNKVAVKIRKLKGGESDWISYRHKNLKFQKEAEDD